MLDNSWFSWVCILYIWYRQKHQGGGFHTADQISGKPCELLKLILNKLINKYIASKIKCKYFVYCTLSLIYWVKYIKHFLFSIQRGTRKCFGVKAKDGGKAANQAADPVSGDTIAECTKACFILWNVCVFMWSVIHNKYFKTLSHYCKLLFFSTCGIYEVRSLLTRRKELFLIWNLSQIVTTERRNHRRNT